MRKAAFLFIFLFAVLKVSASHNRAGYFNYKVENSNLLEVELHLFQDLGSFGFQFYNYYVVTGARNFTVYKVDSVHRPISDSLCPDHYIWEYIYKGSVLLNGTGQAGLTFDLQLGCCRVNGVNLNDSVLGNTAYLSFHVAARLHNPSPGTQYWALRDCNITNDISIVKSAVTDKREVLDFSVDSLPKGIDSVRYRLVPCYQSVGVPSVYNSGYSALAPLPDQSEDTLNSVNSFDSRWGTLSFQARGATSQMGDYFLAVAYDYYRGGSVATTAYSYGTVNLRPGDSTISSSLRLEISTKDSTFSIDNSGLLKFVLNYRDSLEFEVKAFSTAGIGVRQAIFKGLTDTTGLGLGLNQPQVTTLGAQIVNDTSESRFSWAPSYKDFEIRPSKFLYKLVFPSDTCGVNPIMVNILIQLQPSASFANRDTIYACFGQDVQVSKIFADTTFTFGPQAWFQVPYGDTATLLANQSGYIYLVDSSGLSVDSLYLLTTLSDSLAVIGVDPQLTELSFLHQGIAETQEWKINSLLPVIGQREDSLVITGAGQYAAVTELQNDSCLYFTDTIGVEYDFTWGANFGLPGPENIDIADVQGIFGKYYTQTISLNQGMRVIEKIYIQGVRNQTSSTRTLNVELETPDGWSKSLVISVPPGQPYAVIEEEIALTTVRSLEVRVSISGVFQAYLVQGTGSPYSIGGLTFSNFQYDQQPFASRIPLGFRYKGTIGVIEQEFEPLKLYPNPVEDVLYIEGAEEGSEWTFWSITGTQVKTGVLKEGQLSISTADLPRGVYTFQIGEQYEKVLVD